MAKALDPLMAKGLPGLALSIELLGLLMLAPAWHDIVKVCPAAPADGPRESCLQEFHCGLVREHCAVGGPRKGIKPEMGDDCQEQPFERHIMLSFDGAHMTLTCCERVMNGLQQHKMLTMG